MQAMLLRFMLPLLWLGAWPGVGGAANFALDTSHTAVHFAVSHFDVSYVRGSFRKISGMVRFDPAAKTGAVDVRIGLDSVDTGNATLDQVLRSPQFLDTGQIDEARFAGDGFVFAGDTLAAIDGSLVLHGILRPLRLVAQRFTCKDVRAGIISRRVCGGEFRATISRSAFGLTRFLPDVGDAVLLTIDVEAAQE